MESRGKGTLAGELGCPLGYSGAGFGTSQLHSRRSCPAPGEEGRFRLDIRKKFCTMRVVKPWHRLPREAVAAPSLEVFKARLDGALSNLVWWKTSLLMTGGLEPDDL